MVSPDDAYQGTRSRSRRNTHVPGRFRATPAINYDCRYSPASLSPISQTNIPYV